MKKQIFSSQGSEQPFQLTVTGNSGDEPTVARLWFTDGDGKEQLRIEISGNADHVTEVHAHVLGSPLVRKLIKDALKDYPPDAIEKILGKAEEAVIAAGGK